jgi:hypothetical protein
VCASLLYAQHPAGSHSGFSGGFHGIPGSGGFHGIPGSGGVHGGSHSGFHAASAHYSAPSAAFVNSGFGNSEFSGANSLPPPASGISSLAWSQIQRSNQRGYDNVPYGYFSTPYYYPFFGYNNSTYPSYSEQAAAINDPGAQDMMMSQGALGQQLQSLSDQIKELKNAQQRGGIPSDEPGSQVTTPPSVSSVPLTVVLRNGQEMQVQNYAIMGPTFWDFTHQPARKIPIATIDIAASTRATEAKGGEFPPISARP